MAKTESGDRRRDLRVSRGEKGVALYDIEAELSAEGPDFDSALQALDALIADQSGLAVRLGAPPFARSRRAGPWRWAAAMFAAFVLGAIVLSYGLSEGIRRGAWSAVVEISDSGRPYRILERELTKAADAMKPADPEETARLLAALRKILDKYEPYVAEVRRSWNDADPSPESGQ